MSNYNFQIGDKVQLTLTVDGIKKGTAGTISAVGINRERFSVDLEDGRTCTFYGGYLETYLTDKEDFLKTIKTLKETLDDLQEKLDWMDTVNTEKYDADQHRVWKALTFLENPSLSKKEKAKAISKLVNQRG